MTHGMAGRIEAFEFDRLTYFDDITGIDTAIHIGNTIRCILVCDDFGAGRRDHCLVSTDVVAVLMRVEDLGYRPTMLFSGGEALFVIQWVDRQRFTGFGAGDQVIKVSVRVSGPYSLYNHLSISQSSLLLIYVSLLRRYYRLPYRGARRMIVIESSCIRQLTGVPAGAGQP